MKPIAFPEQTHVLAKDQPEYQPLPVQIDTTRREMPVVSCWQLTEEDKKKVLETGVIWLSQWTFGGKLQPQIATVNKEDVVVQVMNLDPVKPEIQKREYIQHYVFEMDSSRVQKCAVCGEVIADMRNVSWSGGGNPPKGWAEGVVYVSKQKNPTVYLTSEDDTMIVEKCKPAE